MSEVRTEREVSDGKERRSFIEFVSDHKKGAASVLGAFVFAGLASAVYIKRESIVRMYQDDQGAELEDYLVKSGAYTEGTVEANFEANRIQIACSDTKTFAPEFRLKSNETSEGAVNETIVEISTQLRMNYLNADDEIIYTEPVDQVESQSVKEFNLLNVDDRTALQGLIDQMPICKATLDPSQTPAGNN